MQGDERMRPCDERAQNRSGSSGESDVGQRLFGWHEICRGVEKDQRVQTQLLNELDGQCWIMTYVYNKLVRLIP